MAVTAYPTILVDSTDGAKSDTACSGAGPATALTGTAASTDGTTGTVVTLDGSPDLSGVATDGSHVIYVEDATAGARRFAAINAVDNTAKTVTVEQAFALSLASKNWAIGGVRATVWGSVSKLLLEQGTSSAGDAMPGWTVQMQDGHDETVTTDGVTIRRAGTAADGPITLQGESGATTKPILRIASDTTHCVWGDAAMQHFHDFSIECTSSTTNGFSATTTNIVADGLTVTCSGANTLSVGVNVNENCNAKRCTITGSGIAKGINVIGDNSHVCFNYIKDCNGDGISLTTATELGSFVYANVINNPGGHGIEHEDTNFASGRGATILNNIVYSATSDGIRINLADNTGNGGVTIMGNLLVSNGGYGINFAGTASGSQLETRGTTLNYNAFYNNTSGTYGGGAPDGTTDVTMTADPFVNAASEDFNINNTANGGASLRALQVTIA